MAEALLDVRNKIKNLETWGTGGIFICGFSGCVCSFVVSVSWLLPISTDAVTIFFLKQNILFCGKRIFSLTCEFRTAVFYKGI